MTDAIESIELTEEMVRNHPDLSQSQREQLLDAMKNDKTASDSDRTVAFIQGHRHVSFSKLRKSTEYTIELEDTI